MGNHHEVEKANETLHWSRRAAGAFAISTLVGSTCIPGVRYALYGNMDPFSSGWPLYLQTSAFLSAFTISILLRCPCSSACGLYAGLVVVMLMVGDSEYPMASAIGLAIHGFLPAAL